MMNKLPPFKGLMDPYYNRHERERGFIHQGSRLNLKLT